ncbi:coordinator of PRMT5 and differentiation stimulator-like, partial [Pteropus vampyrus]|uniref:Coordinator of PRMT5 and differentiation stimulator-like n=1 Tax=Pteropus vampyrus TaxID=132908 RepID=A0A6P3S0X2_PTEVA
LKTLYTCFTTVLLVSLPQIFQAHEKAVSGLSVVLRPPFVDFLASGAQSIPNDSVAGGEGIHSEEEAFAVDDEDSDGELNTWELSEGVSSCPPKEQAADLFNEDWDLELKADQGNPYDADDIQGCISQEVKPWVCCAPQGDMIYDPSWHHPPPLIPHYSKMVFETGQFDDAED